MSGTLIEALHGWQNFYFLAGSASATLMGLMFVAVSLGVHLVAAREGGVRTFVTPTLVHFTLVLLIAALMIIPTHSIWSLGGLLLVTGVVRIQKNRLGWRGGRTPSAPTHLFTTEHCAPITGHFAYNLQLSSDYAVQLITRPGPVGARSAWLAGG